MENVDDKTLLSAIPDIEELLNGLKKNKQMERYRKAFLTLIDLLKNNKKTQERLTNKLREVKIKLSVKEDIIKESEEKQSEASVIIEKLKQDLQKSCKNIEIFETREQSLNDEIEKLQMVILDLKTALKEKDMQKWEEADLDLNTIREMKELRAQVKKLSTDLNSSETKLRVVEEALAEALQLVKHHETELTGLKESLEQELERNVKAEKSRLNAQKAMREKENALSSLKGKLAKLKKANSLLESKVESQKLRVLNFHRRNKELHLLFKKAQKDLGRQLQKINSLNREITSCSLDRQKKDEEIEVLQEKILSYERCRCNSAHRILSLKHHVKASDLTIELLKSELQSIGKDVSAVLTKHSQSEKLIQQQQKEKESLENHIAKLEQLVEKYIAESKENDKKAASARQDFKNSQKCVETQKLTINNLENVQQKQVNEINSLKKKIEHMQSQVSLYQNSANDAKADTEKVSLQLKEQHNMYVSLTSDLTLYYQWYKCAKDSLESLMDRFKNVSNQVCELSQEVEKKNFVIIGLLETIDQLTKKKIKVSKKASQLTTDVHSLKERLKEQEMEVKEHELALKEKITESESLQRKLKSTITSCDVVKIELSQKNNKISELNVQLKKIESELQKKEQQRVILENDLKQAKQELVNSCRDKLLLSEKLSQLERTKSALNQTQKELVQERVRGKAIETEMQHPWNIHRWRLLEGTDPERYQLIMKKHFLQKRLITKTTEAKKKELELNEKEKTLEELKSLVAKQKSLDNQEKSVDLKWQLREKNDKIKVLTSQVNMYESLISTYRTEIANLKEKLKTRKRHMSSQKTEHEKLRHMEYTLSD